MCIRVSAKWHDTTVRQILMNVIYCGDLVGLKSHVIALGENKRRLIPKEQQHITRDAVPVLINREVFEIVQILLEARGSGKKGSVVDRSHKESDSLADKLFCCDCKKPMHKIERPWGKTHFICSTHHRRSRKGVECTGRHSIQADLLWTTLFNEIQEVLLSADQSSVSAEYRLSIGKFIVSLRSQLSGIKQEIRINENRIDRVQDDKYDGKISELQAERSFNKYSAKYKQRPAKVDPPYCGYTDLL